MTTAMNAPRQPRPDTQTNFMRSMLISLFAKHPDSNPTYNAFVTASLVGTLTPIDLNVFAVKSKWNLDLGFDMGHLKAIMRILCAAAEGAPIPGLKAAAQIGLEIVEAVDQARINESECRMIAMQVYRLLQAISERVEGDIKYEQHTGQLRKDLQEILHSVKALSARGKTTRVLNQEQIKEHVVQCEKTIANLQSLFIINMQINTHKRVVAMEGKLDDIHRSILSSSSPSTPKALTPSSASIPPFINSPLHKHDMAAESNSTETDGYTSGSSRTLVASPVQSSPRVGPANPKTVREVSRLRPPKEGDYHYDDGSDENRRSQSLEAPPGIGKTTRPADKGKAKGKRRADTMAVTQDQQRKSREGASARSKAMSYERKADGRDV